jgi:hypothetical protein
LSGARAGKQWENEEEGSIFIKRIPVGRGRQISRPTNELTCNKWPTGHLEREMAGDNEQQVRLGDVEGIDWGPIMVNGLVTGD